MVPNTISSMPNLEELHVPDGFNIRDDGSEISSAPILVEISKLTGLKSLKMFFMRDSQSFKDTNIFGNLTEFNIYVSDELRLANRLQFPSGSIKRSIELEGGNHLELKGLIGLIERAERVKLDGTHLNVGNIYNSNREAFAELRFLHIQKCKTVEYLARMSHGEIQHRRSFAKLTILNIEDCSAMKYLFSSSVVKCLVHLKRLTIERCPEIEAIIMNEGTSDRDGNDIHSSSTAHSSSAISRVEAQPLSDRMVPFPNLVDLNIIGSRKINLEEIEFGRDYSNCQLRSLAMSCYNKMQFSCEWQLRLYNLGSLKLTHYYWWRELKFQCFKRLRWLEIIEPGCSTLFSFSSFESLHQLQSLEISSCDLLEEIVEETSGKYKKTVTFFKLTSVTLQDLPNLKSCFHGANYECHMPALVSVYVDNCGISALYTCSVIRTFQQLKFLRIWNCRLLEDIVEDARGDETSETNDKIITLPRLQLIDLQDLPILKSFSRTSSYAFNFPSLSSFDLHRCPQIEKFTSLETSTRTVCARSDWHLWTFEQDLNDYIRKNCKREDEKLSIGAGESSYSNQELETESERVGKEQLRETEENDQQ